MRLTLFALMLTCALIGKAQNIDSLQQKGIFFSLDSALKYPYKVIYLDLNGQGLKEFPVEILQFRNLVVLHMECAIIPFTEREIAKIEHRKQKYNEKHPNRLMVKMGSNPKTKCNNIKRIPEKVYEEIGSLKHLKEVIISSSGSIKKMERLKAVLPEDCVFTYPGDYY